MGKTRDLLKKITDTKGTFQAKMGTIKDRNGMDLTEAEDINKKWQEYTEELYKKGFNDPDNHDGMVTHLEPDIVECEVKWILRSITTHLLSLCQLDFCLYWSFKWGKGNNLLKLRQIGCLSCNLSEETL